MLSLMAAAAIEFSVTSTRSEHRAWDEARADAVLDAAVTRAALGIAAPDVAERWRVDGAARRFAFDGASLDIVVQDERGRFDLNTINSGILDALLRSAGLAGPDADTLTDRILDWRSASNLHRLHGATDEDYAAAGLAYRQRHGPFQTVDELRLVLGMPPGLFAHIRPALTVYTRQSGIDSTVATREALLALYSGDAQKVDAIIAARFGNAAPTDGVNASSSPGIGIPTMSLTGRAFSIDAATTINGRRFFRKAIVEFTGDDKRAYLTMAWK